MKKDFSGLQNLREMLASLGVQKDTFLRQTTRELAQEFLAEVKQRSPVDTGALRRSWKVSAPKQAGNVWRATVFTNLTYAPYVEYGHRKPKGKTGRAWVDGQYMMTDAAALVRNSAPVFVERKFYGFLYKRVKQR